jgi:hypothetical protein
MEACTPAGSTARIPPWPRLPARRGAEVEFLPAAIEIIETPASLMGRAVGEARAAGNGTDRNLSLIPCLSAGVQSRIVSPE